MKWKSLANYPPGGWMFQHSGGLAVYTEPTREELIRKVARELQLSEADAWAQIEAQLCARHPDLCTGRRPKESPPVKVASGGSKSPLYRAVAAWLDRVLSSPAESVASDGAVFDRLATCQNCPHARKPDFGCPSCNATLIQARRAATARLAERVHADTAPICSAFGVDCLTAARRGMPKRDNPPPGCWARGSVSPDPTAVDTPVEA